ncbi:hypothetical protein MPTK1_5g03230 [Marchantia polymorpha subsp. ruderalis]|nr:hypothetical protein MARPO_0124s0001 [Marchantia polymorpha]BBN10394.1 hypothetical protein Mp_5g03230 [Marchantia polymorpha subsp. ruderalis]|eukprot:PTQ30424.1 hypothetical protein MARPO_0124s0001 [Marchantia polymorpha]
MSEGGGPDGEDSERRNQWIYRIARGKARHRENNDKAAADGKGKGPLRDRKRATGRRAGKDKDDSDSEEELVFDGMEEEIPRQNLLNSALRTTYTARPTLVIDHSIAGDKIVHTGSSSSLYKFSSLPRKTAEDITYRAKVPGVSLSLIFCLSSGDCLRFPREISDIADSLQNSSSRIEINTVVTSKDSISETPGADVE